MGFQIMGFNLKILKSFPLRTNSLEIYMVLYFVNIINLSLVFNVLKHIILLHQHPFF